MLETTRAVMAVLARPRLWRSALALAPRGWWKTSPHLPLPPRGYRGFRSETMYGDADRIVSANDLVAYLEWCRRMGHRAR